MGYDPVGRCIYCGAGAAGDIDLGDEHIIPLSLAGQLILPAASCHKCERITSGIEDYCAKHIFDEARFHLGIRGRKSKKARKDIQTTLVMGELRLAGMVDLEPVFS